MSRTKMKLKIRVVLLRKKKEDREYDYNVSIWEKNYQNIITKWLYKFHFSKINISYKTKSKASIRTNLFKPQTSIKKKNKLNLKLTVH